MGELVKAVDRRQTRVFRSGKTSGNARCFDQSKPSRVSRDAPLQFQGNGVSVSLQLCRYFGEGRVEGVGLVEQLRLAAPQHPQGDDRDAEDRRGAKAELDAEQPLAGPVDV